ncbi:TPA: galactitol-1-phosphate 5-dehydrogenase, partial [Clostridioides difficile]|nr:galactitol-1-phosphate 5-dehydrogenase [Clostridioides difficile]
GRAWTATLDFMEKGDIIFKPMISDKIGLNEVGDFLSKMSKREINFNKILVEM